MKKKISIITSIFFLLLVITAVYYFTPKTFGKGVNPSSVDHINIFDGNTGEGFTVDDPKDIKYIVENIQSKPMRKGGISLGRMGYKFSVVFIDENDKALVPIFFINSENTIRKDPFFYYCDGGLCVDYLEMLEQQLVTQRKEEMCEIPNLSQYKTDYVGDAPNVINIVSSQHYPDGYSYDSIEIQSDTKPYGLTVFLKVEPSAANLKDELQVNADMTFDLISNLGTLNYKIADSKEIIASYER